MTNLVFHKLLIFILGTICISWNQENPSNVTDSSNVIDTTSRSTHAENKTNITVADSADHVLPLIVEVDTAEVEMTQESVTPDSATNRESKVNKPKAKFELTELDVIEQKIEAEQVLQVSGDISQISLDPKLISKLPNLGEADVFRSLQLMPGVSGSNEASSGLYVRGSTPDQNLVLLDGIPVYSVDHFFGFFSAFNANAISSVDLQKGGFGAEHGGRTSSVLELTGRGEMNDSNETDPARPAFNIGLGMVSANGAFVTPIGKKAALMIAGRRSYTDIIKNSLYQDIFDLTSGDEGEQGTVGGGGGGGGPGGGNNNLSDPTTTISSEPDFYFYDVNAKLAVQATQSDLFSTTFYSGQDDLDNSRNVFVSDSVITRIRGGGPGGGGGGPNLDTVLQVRTDHIPKDQSVWGNIGGSGSWKREWFKNFSSTATGSYSNYFERKDLLDTFEIRRDELNFFRGGKTEIKEENDVYDYSGRVDLDWLYGDGHSVHAGGSATLNRIVYSNVRNGNTIENRFDRGEQWAGYLSFNSKFMERLQFVPGLRLTYFDRTDEHYWEPRASADVEILDGLHLKGAWGVYHQFVTRVLREDILNGNNYFWTVSGSPEVPVASSTHYIAGISYDIDDWLFDIEGYIKPMEGLVEFSERQQAINAGGGRGAFGGGGFGGGQGGGGGNGPGAGGQGGGQGGGGAAGVEFYFSGSGTARGIEFLIQRKLGMATGWVSYTIGDVLYDFNGLNSGEIFPADHDQTHEIKIVGNLDFGAIDLSATWVFATGKPYTAPIGTYDIITLSGDTTSFYRVTDKNELRLPNYHRMDVSATYELELGERFKGQIGLSIFNVYNHINIWYRQFQIEERQRLITEVNLIGFTPNLFLNVEF